MGLFASLQGYKTYLGAIGLLALGIFQVATGQIPAGLHSVFMAVVAVGLRGAIAHLKF